MPLSTSYTPLSGATQEPRPLLGRRPGKALEMKDPREVAASKLKELSLPETSSLVAPSSRSETPTGISTTSASLNVEETFSVKLDQ
ncbi:unnamed protein product [Protopolystoma xenopodis]|uniref:Uncharacterized protein n=1 Tax=Protopolystoma xenopodis TaxID=117903 RepID=A0A448WQG3_9PLAT|nr:unnamed protein product [Protopolystoma xenopodis]